MNRELTRKIKLLKGIKPDPARATCARDILLSQIKAQAAETPTYSVVKLGWVYTQGGVADVYRYTLGLLFAKPLNSAMTMSVFLLSAVAATLASGGSMPGEPLYTVKKTAETIQVALVSPDERATLETELAEKRLQELKVLTQGSLGQAEKEKALESIANDVEANLETVSKTLDTLKNQSEAKRVTKVATLLNQKTSTYKSLISQAQENTKLPDTQEEKLDQVSAKINQAQFKALELIIDKKDSSGISEQEVASNLESNLRTTERELAALSVRVLAAGVEKTIEPLLIEKSDQAKRILQEAKEFLVRKEFKTALEKISQTKDILSNVRTELKRSNHLKDADVKTPDSKNQNNPKETNIQIGF